MQRFSVGVVSIAVAIGLAGTQSASAGTIRAAADTAATLQGFSVKIRPTGRTIDVVVRPNDLRVKWDAFLNGKRVTPVFRATPPRGRVVVVGASQGVRFGRNRFTVVARYPNRTKRIVRHFTVNRARPIASAGPDRAVLGNSIVHPTAKASRAARGGKLGYRWTLTRKPAGSNATISGATKRKPRLTTDKVGTYELRVDVRERGRRGAARTAAASAPTGALRSDTASVVQRPNDAKRGYFVNAKEGSLFVAGGPLAGTYPTGASNGQAGPSVLLMFDRATLAPLAAPLYYSASASGSSNITTAQNYVSNALKALPAGHTAGAIGLVSGVTQDIGVAPFFTQTLGVQGAQVASLTPTASFAFYAGLASGTSATPVPGSSYGEVIPPGSGRPFTGVLSPDNFNNFDFSPNDVPATNRAVQQFHTSPSGININGSLIASGQDAPCPGSAGGYQVRVLDASTLADVRSPNGIEGPSYFTNSCDDGLSTAAANDLVSYLTAVTSSTTTMLVFVQGFGVPVASNASANVQAALVSAGLLIRSLGGSAEAFAQNSDATKGPSYAFVGRNFRTNGLVTGTPDPSTAQVTTVSPIPNTAAELSGTFKRDQRWHFVVDKSVNGNQFGPAAGGANVQLQSAAQTATPSLAPTPYPSQTDPAYLAILDYTARTNTYNYGDNSIDSLQSTLCYPVPAGKSGNRYTIDIRALYCGGSKSQGSWEFKASTLLGQVAAGQVTPPPGVTKAQYEAVLNQLISEGSLVDNMNSLTATLIAPYGSQSQTPAIDVGEVATDINKAVQTARKNQAAQFAATASTWGTGAKLSVLGDLLSIGDVIVDSIPGADAIGTILSVAAEAASLAGEYTNDATGAPELGPFVSGTVVANIAGELTTSYAAYGSALERTRDLIISDWGRLQATKGISISSDSATPLEDALHLSTNRFIWKTMFQTLYKPTKLVATGYNPAPMKAQNYRCAVVGTPPLFSSEEGAQYFWRPWGKQGTFDYAGNTSHLFEGRDNLAPNEAAYTALATGYGGQEAFIVSSGGYGYPFPSYPYSDREQAPPFGMDTNFPPYIATQPENLPPNVFAPLFATPNAASTGGATTTGANGGVATNQGFTAQLLWPQIIADAKLTRNLNTLECDVPADDLHYADETQNSNAVK